MKRRVGLVAAVLGIASLAAVPANAGSILWNFSYDFPNSGLEASGSGTLTTNDVLNGDNSYTIIDITGTRTYNGSTDTITGLVPPGGLGDNDNKLYPTGQFLDDDGLTFTIDNPTNNGQGGNEVNIYHDSSGYTEFADPVGFGDFTITPASASTPEPSSLLMSGTGVLLLLGCAWRRRTATATA